MGNKTGWIVSGIVLGAVLLFLIFFVFMPTPDAPYNTNEVGFMELKEPATPLTAILPTVPSEEGNAAEDYVKAITFYKQHAGDVEATADVKPYDAAVASKDPWSNPNFKACRDLADMVAKGSYKKEFKYIFVMTPQKLEPYFQVDEAEDFYRMTKGPFQCFQVHRDRKEYPQAEKRIQDIFLVGWHLFHERARADMSIHGLDIMIQSLDAMIDLYELWPEAPKNRLSSMHTYRRELSEIRENFQKKRNLLWDTLPYFSASNDQFYPGDVFNMVENEQDHAWKVQAILCLGPMKYRCVNSRGNIKRTNDLIAKYLNSNDPMLKAAAECSRDLTKAKYENLGNVDY